MLVGKALPVSMKRLRERNLSQCQELPKLLQPPSAIWNLQPLNTRISVLRSARDKFTIPLVALVPLCTGVFALVVFFHTWSLLLPWWGTGRFISGIWALLINSMLTPSRKAMQLCPLSQPFWAERHLHQEMARFHEYHAPKKAKHVALYKTWGVYQ